MIPYWMKQSDNYVPPKEGGTFAIKTIKSISIAIGKLRFQQGHEKGHALPAGLKLLLLIALIILLSVSQHPLVALVFTTFILAYLATWPAEDISYILKTGFVAALFTLVVLIPAMIINPAGRINNIILVWKVFLSIIMVSIFNHTTQWNHLTEALRKIHIPGIFIFTLDITLKYIVLLGRFINDLLTAYTLRAVGRNNKKYQSVGGVMGVAFLRGTQMSQEMYEAMVCRGFTDDYKGL